MPSSYDAKPIRANMRPSPLADYNNLSLTGQTHLVFAHPRAACLLSSASIVPGTAAQVKKVEPHPADIVRSVHALPQGSSGYVLMSTASGIQVLDHTCSHQLFQWTLPEVQSLNRGSSQGETSGQADGVGAAYAPFVRGTAMSVSNDGSMNICYGTGAGKLHVLEVDAKQGIQGPSVFTHHSSPITCMTSDFHSYHGRQVAEHSRAVHLLATADESGSISLWQAVSPKEYKVVSTITSPQSIPATSLAIRHDCLVAARLSGVIQVFNLEDMKLRVEITAHSRWLTCMDIHPTKDIVASGAEDGTINMWTLPVKGQKVANLLSSTWMHAAVTGVAFCGPTFDDLAVVAYDTDELRVYKPLMPT